ncbi:uncharacterized protein BDW43DRAFT_14838 [Aspergillus alliaceus]|uniref:uncharacterized protein n=1 Tax=Petromyces alliaceus TaxID=209559 RepID=UPI0012A584EB|nr:uncharacterized protein BDW43DRAFT_14838 [Aspergillus alliaceus]KAB8239871.1 hypothetical protein BDW43DRAFT_14838 [Aspergillus alliaceus]
MVVCFSWLPFFDIHHAFLLHLLDFLLYILYTQIAPLEQLIYVHRFFFFFFGLFKSTFIFGEQEAACWTHLIYDTIPRHWDGRIADWTESGILSDQG